jgi:hypothetical protein
MARSRRDHALAARRTTLTGSVTAGLHRPSILAAVDADAKVSATDRSTNGHGILAVVASGTNGHPGAVSVDSPAS